MDNFAEFTGFDNYLCYTSFWCFDDYDKNCFLKSILKLKSGL
ncbi:MAG TPA: hypothetical protein PLS66_12630 [Tepiditoga sp.]|nr:hypothetical protein [Tepiditoga sp.]